MSISHNQFVADIVGLFSSGLDTAELADFLDCHESIVTRALHIGLERRKADEQAERLAEEVGRLANELGHNV